MSAGATSGARAAGPEALVEAAVALRTEVGRRILGQERVIDEILMAVLAGGHALLVGVPGLAKTLIIRSIAETMRLAFRRIQFTPDLVPSDITGTEIMEEDQATGGRTFRFVRGPVFANVILADEINRTPPKTQAALLEAMQERHVTIAGVMHPLPDPFFVLATQNPIEQEGTYPLPEAQLDRFMFQILISYPSQEEEVEIVRRSRGEPHVAQVLSGEDICRVQKLVHDAPVADHVIRYALRLVRATRIRQEMDGGLPRPQMVTDYVGWGAGPRASEFLVLAAKAKAIMDGSAAVTPEHVRSVAKPVLRHRILTNFNAEADQVTTDQIIDALLEEIPVEPATARERKQLDEVMPG